MAPFDDNLSPAYQAIYATVRRVPPGRVATYGQIAREAGLPRRARQVGYALHALPEGHDVPWQRVVNAKGEISLRSASHGDEVQRLLLEEEGIEFSPAGRIDLKRFGWVPPPQGPPRDFDPLDPFGD